MEINQRQPAQKPISVLMSVYVNDSLAHVKSAIDSIFNQTLLCSEFIIIIDGPVEQNLEQYLKQLEHKLIDIKLFSFSENRGLGKSLAFGVQKCSHNIIARMDADDLSHQDRFSQQWKAFETIPELSIVGGYIEEFKSSPHDLKRIREVPTTDHEIRRVLKQRNPFNHMTVMFKKDIVLVAGNYQHMTSGEDYFLWLRLLKRKSYAINIPKILVYARIGNGFEKRRRGLTYFKHEFSLQTYMLKNGFIGWPRYTVNLAIRIFFRNIPEKLQNLIYKALLRRKKVNP